MAVSLVFTQFGTVEDVFATVRTLHTRPFIVEHQNPPGLSIPAARTRGGHNDPRKPTAGSIGTAGSGIELVGFEQGPNLVQFVSQRFVLLA
jgi:hypothetical protein